MEGDSTRGRGRGGRGRGNRRARASSDAEGGGQPSSSTSSKKPRREIPKDSPILALFQSYSTTLDTINDRHERLVKHSRDLTIGSKRLIFLLQRNDERQALLAQADTDLALVLATLEKIVLELESADGEQPKTGASGASQTYWQHRRAFSPGLQEFIEAVSFLHYIRHSSLITREEIEDLIRTGTPNKVELYVNDEDYLLGLADLTGELMRRAIGAINAGDVEEAHAIRSFLQALYEGYQRLATTTDRMRDMRQKIGVMEASVKKVEGACLALCIQGVEKLALLGTSSLDDRDD